MSKKMILTVSDELDKYLKTKSDELGISKLDYIRFVIMKQKEQDVPQFNDAAKKKVK